CFFCSSRRRHTRSKRDWSSDVCSSDLLINNTRCWSGAKIVVRAGCLVGVLVVPATEPTQPGRAEGDVGRTRELPLAPAGHQTQQIGRASCREREEPEEAVGCSKGNKEV